MRYASTRNFTKKVVYPVARCLLRRAVAEKLAAVQRDLESRGMGLKLWDCYRPISVQKAFWKLVPDPRYVAPVEEKDGKVVSGSKHNRGAAVDLTLVDSSGDELAMPTDHDDFSRRAHRDYTGGSTASRRNRAVLARAMTRRGFTGIPTEWWHFDGPGWRRFPLSNQPLGR
jgi:beta-N-acetylhexosaminidase/D-alanyl-D-alanine dipeptidase